MLVRDAFLSYCLAKCCNIAGDNERLPLDERYRRRIQWTPKSTIRLSLALIQFNWCCFLKKRINFISLKNSFSIPAQKFIVTIFNFTWCWIKFKFNQLLFFINLSPEKLLRSTFFADDNRTFDVSCLFFHLTWNNIFFNYAAYFLWNYMWLSQKFTQ